MIMCETCNQVMIYDTINGEFYCEHCGQVSNEPAQEQSYQQLAQISPVKTTTIIESIPKLIYGHLNRQTKTNFAQKPTIDRNFEMSLQHLKSVYAQLHIIPTQYEDLDYKYRKFYYDRKFFNKKRRHLVEWFASVYGYLYLKERLLPFSKYEFIQYLPDYNSKNEEEIKAEFYTYIEKFVHVFKINLIINTPLLIKNYTMRMFDLLYKSQSKEEQERTKQQLLKFETEKLYVYFVRYSKLSPDIVASIMLYDFANGNSTVDINILKPITSLNKKNLIQFREVFELKNKNFIAKLTGG